MTDNNLNALNLIPGELYVFVGESTNPTYYMFLRVESATTSKVAGKPVTSYRYLFLVGDEVIDLVLYEDDADSLQRVSS